MIYPTPNLGQSRSLSQTEFLPEGTGPTPTVIPTPLRILSSPPVFTLPSHYSNPNVSPTCSPIPLPAPNPTLPYKTCYEGLQF